MFESGTYRVWQTDIGDPEPDPADQESGVLVVSDDKTGQTNYWVPTGDPGTAFPFVSDSDFEYWILRVAGAEPVGHMVASATIDLDDETPIIHDWQPWVIEIDGSVDGMAFAVEDTTNVHFCHYGEAAQTQFPYVVDENVFAKLSPSGNPVQKKDIDPLLKNEFGNGWKSDVRRVTKQ